MAQNRLPLHYYAKSETFNLWRTGAWILKTLGERVEENHIYDLVKKNSTVKTRAAYKGVTYVTKTFWKLKKLTLRIKSETLT